MTYKKKSKKVKRHVDSVVAHVKSSFNNTIVTVTTSSGDVLLTKSAGALGFKGSRKGTPYAAGQVATILARDMEPLGVKTMEVNLQGPGSGRESVVRAFQAAGFSVTMLRDVTPLPHNGCRAPKKRRV
ncbi:TPA: 30S ribosomal protein S11 [Candidatus Dependentiae bacterium]|nr:MAG: 30S ribosomal protein S11 [candidate division TM6 bacterium GW2011_GWF2_36_131]KKQ03061.1 MAG: 30S ribosomal protein S11 [candidate division TM6 bacterium GW2011_GWE2_36_25]KKQ19628.1 MAG: 30S ribosomal protein S11 [candidate division TM6 bacterium GW2011_GWA2_36_9]HBR71143.1 30S ribosomal protein S11 [Candidatus Dependentiae bacterium]HCU00480.1 30S ribosomal protein S11 [Candidatus Dependentiae bacterium]